MQHTRSEAHLFMPMLKDNNNPEGYKELLASVARGIEERTFWYFTCDETQYLGNIYEKQLDKEVLKNRIQQITTEKMDELTLQIIEGTIKKQHQEENDSELQVQLDIKNIIEEMPSEEELARKNIEKVKEINQDYIRFRQKMEEKRRALENKKAQKEALQAEFKKSLEKERRQQHRKQIRQHIQSLKKKDDQRKEENDKFKSFLKQYKKAKPLHVLMQETYKEKVILPALEESRRKLESLGHRKKPTLQEINDHDRLYMQTRSNRPQKVVLLNSTIDVSYKSHFYKEEEHRLQERKEFEQTGPAWDYLQKQKRYSQFVKDKCVPRISKKLKESLIQTVEQSHVHKQSPDRSRYIEVGKNYLQYMRNLQKRRTSTPSQPVETVKQSRYLNYLQEMKSKSEHHNSSMDWQKDMRDRTSSRIEKRERVIMKSKQLEEKAMRDEKLVSHYNYGRAEDIIAKKKQIDDTLLSSIRAKVAVLKDAQNQ